MLTVAFDCVWWSPVEVNQARERKRERRKEGREGLSADKDDVLARLYLIGRKRPDKKESNSRSGAHDCNKVRKKVIKCACVCRLH